MPVRQDYVHCGAILQVMNPANRQRCDLIYDRELLPMAATFIACPFKNRRRRLGYDDVLAVVMHILQPQEAEESKEQREWNRSPGDKMQPFAQRSHASSDCLCNGDLSSTNSKEGRKGRSGRRSPHLRPHTQP